MMEEEETVVLSSAPLNDQKKEADLESNEEEGVYL
jgi:hypothetical protein